MRIRTFIHGRSKKLVTALAALAVAGIVSGLAAAALNTSGVDVPIAADKAAAMANRMPTALTDASFSEAPSTPPAFVPDPIPARILGPDVPVPISGSILNATNGWVVSNGYNLVAVYAGSKADDPTQGRIVIVRQDLRAVKQTVQTIDAGATGALAVGSDAPAGAAVESSALTGTLALRTSRGGTLKLNLATNAIGG